MALPGSELDYRATSKSLYLMRQVKLDMVHELQIRDYGPASKPVAVLTASCTVDNNH